MNPSPATDAAFRQPVPRAHTTTTLVLASQSPARAKLLREAGYDFHVARSGFVDDPAPPQGHHPDKLAIELAMKKAEHVQLDPAWGHVVILAADTIGVHRQDGDTVLLGQPQSIDEAREMLRQFMNQTHQVVTGAVLASPESDKLEAFADVAHVTLGHVEDEALEAYLHTGSWRGKAGGCSLSHVQSLGWPVQVQGDPTTVQGLPMKRLTESLAAWGVVR
jgi:septum formation protein